MNRSCATLALILVLAAGGCSPDFVAPAPPFEDIAPETTVVFDMLVDGRRNIYRAALEGAAVIALTQANNDAMSPSIGGGWLVFTALRAGVSQIYRVPLTGGTSEALRQVDADETDPAISPDGSRLAWISAVDGASKLWVGSGNAQQARRVTTDTRQTVELAPAWHPDNTRLAFASTARLGRPEIYLHDLVRDTTELLIGGEGTYIDPAFSPDGTRLAYVASLPGESTTDLYVLDMRTGEVQRVVSGHESEGQPAWLTDDRIAFIAKTPARSVIRSIDLDTGTLTTVQVSGLFPDNTARIPPSPSSRLPT